MLLIIQIYQHPAQYTQSNWRGKHNVAVEEIFHSMLE
jgi:hypothetical protein